MPTEPNPPRVFISYSHDSRDHLDRVLALADRLRAEGIDCNLDQYEPAPAEGWPRWMKQQIRQANFIVAVCTETYCRRFEGEEEPRKGLGVTWEGAILTAELYHDKTINKRIIPVVFSATDIPHIPAEWSAYNYYLLYDEGGYEDLYRRLTNQPRVIKPILGTPRSLPPENRQQDFPPIQKDLRSTPQSNPAPLPVPVVPLSRKPQLRHENFVEDLGKGVKLEMIAIPGGTFQMGSNENRSEQPIHRVTLSPFHIGTYQVTQAQWRVVMKSNPSRFKGDNLPVENVSWEMAAEFCEKLSKKTGRNYRLPTEAEWEYACRAGSTTKYCFGNDETLLEKYAWYDKNAGGTTHPVGEKLPNGWGLYDMQGNVWEWCNDWYGGYSAEAATDPSGPSTGSYRVYRGGGWDYFAVACRSAYRGDDAPGNRHDALGFRLVRIGR